MKRHRVFIVGELEQRRDLVEDDVAADSQLKPANGHEVTHSAGRQLADWIDELVAMGPMDDLRKEKNLCFDGQVLEAAEDAGPPPSLGKLEEHRAYGTEAALVSSDGSGHRRRT